VLCKNAFPEASDEAVPGRCFEVQSRRGDRAAVETRPLRQIDGTLRPRRRPDGCDNSPEIQPEQVTITVAAMEPVVASNPLKLLRSRRANDASGWGQLSLSVVDEQARNSIRVVGGVKVRGNSVAVFSSLVRWSPSQRFGLGSYCLAQLRPAIFWSFGEFRTRARTRGEKVDVVD